jgi:hypothetical protein
VKSGTWEGILHGFLYFIGIVIICFAMGYAAGKSDVEWWIGFLAALIAGFGFTTMWYGQKKK